jgi:predicted ATPase
VLLVGEPGIGKTRLVEEFRERIRADPHLWIEAAGAPLFSNSPFHAVIQMLDQGLGWRGDDTPQERFRLLEQGLERSGLNRALRASATPEKSGPWAGSLKEDAGDRVLSGFCRW